MCVTAALVLWRVYQRGFIDHSAPGVSRLRYDRGFLYLAVAVLAWGLVGVALIFVDRMGAATGRMVRTGLSIANSTALIFAAAHLDYGTKWLDWLKRDTLTREFPRVGMVFVGLVIVSVALTALLSVFGLAELVDFTISIIIITILMLGLWESFRARGFRTLPVVAIAVLAFQVIAQVPEISPAFAAWLGEWRWIIVLNSKIMVIFLFLALAFSWMHQKYSEAELNVELFVGSPASDVRLVIRDDEYAFRLGPVVFLRLLELAFVRALDTHNDGYIPTRLMFGRGANNSVNIDNHTRSIRNAVRDAMGARYDELDIDIVQSRRRERSRRLNVKPENIHIDTDAVMAWRRDQNFQAGDDWADPLLADWLQEVKRVVVEDTWIVLAAAPGRRTEV